MSQGGWEAQATDLMLLHLTGSPLGESKVPVFFWQLNRDLSHLASSVPSKLSSFSLLPARHAAGLSSLLCSWHWGVPADMDRAPKELQGTLRHPSSQSSWQAPELPQSPVSMPQYLLPAPCAPQQSTSSLLLSHLISHQEPFSSLRASPTWSQNRSASLQLPTQVPEH